MSLWSPLMTVDPRASLLLFCRTSSKRADCSPFQVSLRCGGDREGQGGLGREREREGGPRKDDQGNPLANVT